MTAKALGFALKKPVVGVASFDAIAVSLSPDVMGDAATLVVATDARRDRLYVGHYDPRTRTRRDLGVRAAPRVLDGATDPVVLAGYALDAYPGLLARGRFVEAHAPARIIARLGFDAYRTQPAGASLHDVKPLYLRAGLAAEE
jgi:tRNA A37 threonylcarbamoyladenosine modification protein TsaB